MTTIATIAMIGRWMRRAVLAMAVLAVSAAPALAQQFEKVDRIQREEIPAARFVAIAYGIIWLAILTYVLFVAGGLRRVNDEIADLRRRLRSKE